MNSLSGGVKDPQASPEIPPILSDEQVEGLVSKHYSGETRHTYGPFILADEWYWEVWTYDDEWQTRYVSQSRKGTRHYPSFQALCVTLNERLKSKEIEDLEKILKFQSQKTDLIARATVTVVAALAFISTVAGFLYVMTSQHGSVSTTILAILGGVVASGGALFFGKWVPFKPGATGKET